MTKRRQFIGTSLAMGAAMVLPTGVLGEKKLNEAQKVLPKRLAKGNTIGLIAPGYAITEAVLADTVNTLHEMGFKTHYTDRILGSHGYFSDTDAERAADVNEMFANPEIDGILCARGGYGCTRIMHLIDFNTIAMNPKCLIGFSDVTTLLNGIYKETGLVTFHGPVGSTLNDAYSIEQLEKVVMHAEDQLKIENAKLTDPSLLQDEEYERYIVTAGVASGKLVGGSLTLVNALIGTPHEIDFTDAVVCIEDVEEAPYRIDRMLTQLIEGATFKKAAGIVFGVCAGCNESTNPRSFTLKEVILDRISPLGIPSVYGMSFGHVANNFTFPIGIRAMLDTQQMSLELLEPAVL